MFICIIFFGCSIPKMLLNHEDQLNITYENRGTIKISLFEDRRPGEEKIEGETAMNTLSPQIWSGSTSPEMMLFFQESLIKEAEKTSLFNVRDASASEFELSGYVTSMKVDRKVTLWRYAAIVPATLGLIGFLSSVGDALSGMTTGQEEKVDFSYLLIGAAGSVLLLSLDTPTLTATVKFHATLKKNGSIVFEKDIALIMESNYSVWSEWGWQDVSDKASIALDQTITESIAMLFEEIDSEI
jgi:hypothetical protein